VIRDVSWSRNMGLYKCYAHNSHGSDHSETFLYPVSNLTSPPLSRIVALCTSYQYSTLRSVIGKMLLVLDNTDNFDIGFDNLLEISYFHFKQEHSESANLRPGS